MTEALFARALDIHDISLLLRAFDEATPEKVPPRAVDALVAAAHLDSVRALCEEPDLAVEAYAVLSEIPRYFDRGLVSPEVIAGVFTAAVAALQPECGLDLVIPALAGIVACGFRTGLVRRASELISGVAGLAAALAAETSPALVAALVAVIGSPVAATVDRPVACRELDEAISLVMDGADRRNQAVMLGCLGDEMVTIWHREKDKRSDNAKRAAADYVAENFIPKYFASVFDTFWRANNPEYTCCLLRFVRGTFLHPKTAAAALAHEPLLISALCDAGDTERAPEVMRWRYECVRAAQALLAGGECLDMNVHADKIKKWIAQGPFVHGNSAAAAPDVAMDTM